MKKIIICLIIYYFLFACSFNNPFLPADLHNTGKPQYGALSSNNNLSSLLINPGLLDPTFDKCITAYRSYTANAARFIQITPYAEYIKASIRIKLNHDFYICNASGIPSGDLTMDIGDNTIDILVYAENNSIKNYSITVRRNPYEMITLPAGINFNMGYPWVAQPAHTIPAINSFKTGECEVSYELWYNVRIWAEANGYVFTNPGREGNDGADGGIPTDAMTEPVTNISWMDIIAWCNAFSEKDNLIPVYYIPGQPHILSNVYRNSSIGSIGNSDVEWAGNGYRLPTEAEWEYAARYIDGSSWVNGNEISGTGVSGNNINLFAWYSGNSSDATHNAGGKLSNSIGIYDLSGNVWEWCWDWYGAYSGSSPYTDPNPKGPLSGTYRVIRGGSWYNLESDARVSYRSNDYAYSASNRYGFRLIKNL